VCDQAGPLTSVVCLTLPTVFPQVRCDGPLMPGWAGSPDPSSMRRSSYAVWWNEGNGPRHIGKLEIARLHALLSGNGSKRLAVPLDDITAVDYRRGEVRLDRRGATPLRIGSLDAPGALLELAHSLGS
jgi:hypothetical protein